jgi:hypothetical protein
MGCIMHPDDYARYIINNGLPSDFLYYREKTPEEWHNFLIGLENVADELRNRLIEHIRTQSFSFKQLQNLVKKHWPEEIEEIICRKLAQKMETEEQLIFVVRLSKGRYYEELCDSTIGEYIRRLKFPHKTWINILTEEDLCSNSSIERAIILNAIKTASKEEIVNLFFREDSQVNPNYVQIADISIMSLQDIRDAADPKTELFKIASLTLNIKRAKKNHRIINQT